MPQTSSFFTGHHDHVLYLWPQPAPALLLMVLRGRSSDTSSFGHHDHDNDLTMIIGSLASTYTIIVTYHVERAVIFMSTMRRK